jgi:hypothetical protein
VVKLVPRGERRAPGSLYDIQVTTQYGDVSFSEDACTVKEILDPELTTHTSRIFVVMVVTCKEMVSTYMFHTSIGGVSELIEIKVGTPTYDKVRIPAYQGNSRFVVLNELVDDRQAMDNFNESQYRTWDVGRLRQEGKEWEIESNGSQALPPILQSS